MIDTLKTIGISVLVVIVALLLTGNIGGTTNVGGTYEITKQFFNAGVEATDVTVTDDLVVGSASATTSSNFGKACFTVTTASGATAYLFFNGTANTAALATTTAANCL